MHMRSLLLALAVLAVACKKSDDTQKAASAATTGSGSAAAVPSGNVLIFVDEQPAGSLAPDKVALWPRLDTLVPVSARRLGTWQTIRLVGTGGAKPVEINQPSGTYPDLVPALFPGEGGAAAFGMFDPVEHARKGKPALQENRITEVRVILAKGTGRGENDHHGEGGGGDPASLTLTIKSAKGEHVLDGAKLLALTREPAPGHGDGDGGKGWKLALLLEQAGITTYERLVLTDAKGVNLTLEKQDLDPATSVPFVKLNRQGTLRFRVFKKQGDTWQPGSDLRGLTTIEVLK